MRWYVKYLMAYKPCPKCSSTGAERLNFTWWGGVIGPKILTDVKCPHCGHSYNGRTGGITTTGIAIYSAVVAMIISGFLATAFTAARLLTFFVK